VLTLGGAAAAAADASDGLYGAKTILTGQEEPNRSVGIAKCLKYVLVKVTGDPRLVDDPRVPTVVADARTFVLDFHYRDLMEGIPIHDEQGTRERPYELTVTFDPAKINAAVRSLGSEPWVGPRPLVVIFVAVRNGTATYTLASDGSRGRDQRDALVAAADRFGMPMTLPSQATLSHVGLTFDTLPTADLSDLAKTATAAGGDLALAGTLDWSDEALGWVAEWRFSFAGTAHRWRVSGVNFDDAFRSGVGAAAQILSGHGSPD